MRIKTVVLLILTMVLLVYAVNRQPGEPLPVSSMARTGDTPEVTWAMLRGLNAQTGETNEEVRAIDGQTIRVAGYIVPLDDDHRELSEFLLVPYVGACIHTPPPPPNQMIYVKMTRNERARFGLMDGVWVTGKVFLGRRGSPYGPTFYAMTASNVEEYR
jgi:hypothetical protein